MLCCCCCKRGGARNHARCALEPRRPAKRGRAQLPASDPVLTECRDTEPCPALDSRMDDRSPPFGGDVDELPAAPARSAGLVVGDVLPVGPPAAGVGGAVGFQLRVMLCRSVM